MKNKYFNTVFFHSRFFPKGGGHVTVDITPVKQIQNADITDRGSKVNKISGWSFVSGTLPMKVNSTSFGIKNNFP